MEPGRSCTETIERHASVRSFTGEPIPEEDLRRVLEAARRAPTGWNLQPVTVIVVRDSGCLEQLADAVGGQEHVAKAAAFLVFAVDYAKIVRAAEKLGLKAAPGPANLYEALIDVGIMAGWAMLAAESMGYGGVFVALYENPCAVAEILEMPRYTIPAVGLALGRPAEHPAPRRRQRLEALAPHETYGDVEEKAEAVLEVYGDRARRLFSYIFEPEGYYASATERLLLCLEKQGFSLSPGQG
jgi:FMN reductase [NAD(P)H]